MHCFHLDLGWCRAFQHPHWISKMYLPGDRSSHDGARASLLGGDSSSTLLNLHVHGGLHLAVDKIRLVALRRIKLSAVPIF